MQYADFLGFPLRQMDLIQKPDGLTITSNSTLDLCHTTSVAPFVKKLDDIIGGHRWLKNLIDSQKPNTKFVYGLQHPPESATIYDLERLHASGIQFMTIAYLGENEYGGGFAVPDVHITKLGEKLLANMAEVGLVLDLSHAGHQTARECLAYIKIRDLPLRVVATHTGCYSANPHLRNLPDDVIQEIAKMNGIVGVILITSILHPSIDTIGGFIFHLNRAVDLVGPEHVAIGSDCIYRTMTLADEQENFSFLMNKLLPAGNDPFGARFPDRPEALKNPDRLLVIAEELSYQFLNQAVEYIMGKNLIRFLA